MSGDDYLTGELPNELMHGRLCLRMQMGFRFLKQRDHVWAYPLINPDPKFAKSTEYPQRSEASTAESLEAHRKGHRAVAGPHEDVNGACQILQATGERSELDLLDPRLGVFHLQQFLGEFAESWTCLLQ